MSFNGILRYRCARAAPCILTVAWFVRFLVVGVSIFGYVERSPTGGAGEHSHVYYIKRNIYVDLYEAFPAEFINMLLSYLRIN